MDEGRFCLFRWEIKVICVVFWGLLASFTIFPAKSVRIETLVHLSWDIFLLSIICSSSPFFLSGQKFLLEWDMTRVTQSKTKKKQTNCLWFEHAIMETRDNKNFVSGLRERVEERRTPRVSYPMWRVWCKSMKDTTLGCRLRRTCMFLHLQ